jgi:hypothetical protein
MWESICITMTMTQSRIRIKGWFWHMTLDVSVHDQLTPVLFWPEGPSKHSREQVHRKGKGNQQGVRKHVVSLQQEWPVGVSTPILWRAKSGCLDMVKSRIIGQSYMKGTVSWHKTRPLGHFSPPKWKLGNAHLLWDHVLLLPTDQILREGRGHGSSSVSDPST